MLHALLHILGTISLIILIIIATGFIFIAFMTKFLSKDVDASSSGMTEKEYNKLTRQIYAKYYKEHGVNTTNIKL